MEGLRLFGYKVEAHREIDGSATCNGVSGNTCQIIIARKSNLLAGTNKTDKLDSFDMFYDKVSRKIFIDSAVYLGVAIALDEYIYLTTDKIN